MPTRCFMPPDSCDGFLSMAAAEADHLDVALDVLVDLRAIPFGPLAAHRERDVACARSATASARGPGTPRRAPGSGPATSRPSMNTWPALALSSPASTLRMVVLPQPLWPMMQTNSPCAMVKLTSSNTARGAERLASLLCAGTRRDLRGKLQRGAGRSLDIRHRLLQPREQRIEQPCRPRRSPGSRRSRWAATGCSTRSTRSSRYRCRRPASRRRRSPATRCPC